MGIPFHNTIMGKRFFEGQLPALIKSINRLAAAIEKANGLEEGKETETPADVAAEFVKNPDEG